MHAAHKLGVANGALLASFCSHWWGWAAKGCNHRVPAIVPMRRGVVPLGVHQLCAWTVAPHRVSCDGMLGAQIMCLGPKLLRSRAAVEAEARAVQLLDRGAITSMAPAPTCGEFEGQRETVHEADVYPVQAPSLRNMAVGSLKLRVDGRGALGVVIFAPREDPSPNAGLCWSPTSPKKAMVAFLVAEHLGPEPGPCKPMVREKVKGLMRRNLDILRVGPDSTTCCLMGYPNGTFRAPIPNLQPSRRRRHRRRRLDMWPGWSVWPGWSRQSCRQGRRAGARGRPTLWARHLAWTELFFYWAAHGYSS
mmetsp:Transcript_95809/g.172841  ORF Transcript_95809/g.172841 Transcript_95809/m.172841 type:complete len:306 (+) Transcript_95809:365-1282(+)